MVVILNQSRTQGGALIIKKRKKKKKKKKEKKSNRGLKMKCRGSRIEAARPKKLMGASFKKKFGTHTKQKECLTL